MAVPTDTRPAVAGVTDDEFIERARSLQPLAREASDEADETRHLPARVAEAMAAAGLFRVAAPPSYGGAGAAPRTQMRVIELLSEADGAAGWNLMIGMESFGLICLTFERGAELFADPMTLICSSTASVGEAVKVDGGYKVTGQWQFVSGAHNARWFGGMVFLNDGGHRTRERPVYAFAPLGDYEILDTWHTVGMRGSGSHDVRLDEVFVPDDHIAIPTRPWLTKLYAESPALRIPSGARLSYNKVGVALGVARAAIDEFVALAEGKTPRFGTEKLRERPSAQRAVALAEVRLRAVRALMYELVDQLWADVLAGREMSDKERAFFQIASSDAAKGCIEAVDRVVEAAGTTPNFIGAPLERRSRDIKVVGTHITVAPQHLEDGGRVLLGLEPTSFFFNQLGASASR